MRIRDLNGFCDTSEGGDEDMDVGKSGLVADASQPRLSDSLGAYSPGDRRFIESVSWFVMIMLIVHWSLPLCPWPLRPGQRVRRDLFHFHECTCKVQSQCHCVQPRP